LPTRRRKLLLADDSPTVQKVVSLTFSDEDFEVIAVGTGALALAEIERDVPDIILADVHMPAPDGYELCARVKREERTRRVPVMLLVGSFEPFDEAEARRSGADEVLTKPFQSIRELVNKVGVLLGAQPEAKTADARADEVDADDTTGELRPVTTDATNATNAHAPTMNAHGVEAPADESSQKEQHVAAPAFADLDFDDADIVTATPEEFAARSREQEASAEFAESSASQSRAAAAASSFAPRAQSFAPRDDADDALLELDDVDSTGAHAQTGDLVLDIDDDAGAYVPQRAAQAAQSYADAPAYGESAYADDAPTAVEMQSAGSVSMAEPSIAWVTQDEFAVSPDAITEQVAAPAWGAAETSAPTFDETSHIGETSSTPSHEASEQVSHEALTTGVAQETETQTASRSGAGELSPEAIEMIARRVVEQLSERVVREIAWEVVPDLAERLIRQKLEEERARQ
jgi:CheY-like chemotaxis protein